MGNEMNIDFEIELNNHVRQHRVTARAGRTFVDFGAVLLIGYAVMRER